MAVRVELLHEARSGSRGEIAAFADMHFQVQKHVEGGRTLTRVRRLIDEERTENWSESLGVRESPRLPARMRGT